MIVLAASMLLAMTHTMWSCLARTVEHVLVCSWMPLRHTSRHCQSFSSLWCLWVSLMALPKVLFLAMLLFCHPNTPRYACPSYHVRQTFGLHVACPYWLGCFCLSSLHFSTLHMTVSPWCACNKCKSIPKGILQEPPVKLQLLVCCQIQGLVMMLPHL